VANQTATKLANTTRTTFVANTPTITVSYTVKNANNCSSTVTNIVAVNQRPIG
jgi:hypothetical protein